MSPSRITRDLREPVRVLAITSGFAVDGPLGGIERFGIGLSRSIDASKVKLTLLGMWSYGVENEQIWLGDVQAAGVEAIMPAVWNSHAPIKSFFDCLKQTRKILVNRQFDIIHSHCQFGDVLAICLKRYVRASVLLRTVHNEKEWPNRKGRKLFLTNFLLPILFQKEFGVSKKVVENLNKRPINYWLSKPAEVLNNALNISELEHKLKDKINIQQLKDELNLPSTSKVIGSVGRLVEQKGYFDLIDAALPICKSDPDIYFVVVGDGPLKASLESYVGRLGLNSRFKFAGSRSDIESMYQLMDIFVSCSLWEGLPTVIMESLYMEIPVIATEVSGNTELVINNKTGFLVKAGDPQDISNGIRKMLNLPAPQVAKMCLAGKLHVIKHFSFASISHHHEVLYQEFGLG